MEEKTSNTAKFSQAIKLIFVLGVFPLLVGFIRGLWFEVAKLEPSFYKSLYWGIGIYLILHIFLIEPLKFYKKTQRFIQVIFGFFSPLFKFSYYLIPFWVIVLIVFYILFCKIFKFKDLEVLFFFLSGFFFSMHIVCVAKILKVDELRKLIDYLFMISIVIIINVFFFAFNLKLYSPDFSLVKVAQEGIDSGINMGKSIFNQLFIPQGR